MQSSGANGTERVEREGDVGFIDVHCHCLPGLDDGPPDVPSTLALCRALAADGIRTVVATPHQLGRYDGLYDVATIRQAVAQLNELTYPLKRALGPNCDMWQTAENSRIR